MSLLEWFDKIDKIAFVLIHTGLDNTILDIVLPLLRNAYFWVPLYIYLLCFVIIRFKERAWQFIILTIVCFALTDRISAGILKPFFERPRPCFNIELQPMIRHLIECGGRYSFPSSHASNHFGLAAFWFWSVKFITGKKWIWLWLWALIIGYAQVYIGKHYPLDIAGGALLGFLTGTILAKFFEHWPSFWEITLFKGGKVNRNQL